MTITTARLRESRWALAIIDPRGFAAWRISGVAMPLLGLANRLCPDIPADFHEVWDEGRRHGEHIAAVKTMQLVRLGYEAGVETGTKAASR
jgi:hypothetical protein